MFLLPIRSLPPQSVAKPQKGHLPDVRVPLHSLYVGKRQVSSHEQNLHVIANQSGRPLDEVRVRCKNAKELSCEKRARFVVVVGCDFAVSANGCGGLANVVQQRGPHESAGIGAFCLDPRGFIHYQQSVIPGAALRMVPGGLRRCLQPFQHVERILTQSGGTGELR